MTQTPDTPPTIPEDMVIVYRETSDLIFSEYNPRELTEAQYENIKASLTRFGFVDPVIVNKNPGRDNIIIGGHQRIKVWNAMGNTRVPTVEENLPLDMERELNVRLNKNVGQWDFDMLGNNFDIEELKDWGFTDDDLMGFSDNGSEEEEDAVPEPPAEPRAEKGRVYQLGRHRLMCGDSTNGDSVDGLMDGSSAECVFTSPPYGVGLEYESYVDTMENLRAMLPKLSEIWMRTVTPGGYAVVNFGDVVSASDIVGTDGPCEYPMALEYWPVFRSQGWVLWSRRIMCKPSAEVVSMQCISSNRAATNWEHVWTWKKEGKPIHSKQTTGEYPSQKGWIDTSHGQKLEVPLKVHGAGMPVDVALFSIATHSTPQGIVYEPFIGTGTTMIASETLGRTCYGMEIEPRYCDVTIQRYANLMGIGVDEIYDTAG